MISRWNRSYVPCRSAKRASLWLAGVALSLAALTGGVIGLIEYDGNIHTVMPGAFYRSAQLSAADLDRVIKADGIKTILNLRGDNTGTDWYDDEVIVSKRDGVKHLDFAMSARQPLTRNEMLAVIKMIDQAPKPILVHCKSGADRTGLVSALYRVSQGQPASAARSELSIRYGHFPYLGSRTIAMDDSFKAFVEKSLSR